MLFSLLELTRKIFVYFISVSVQMGLSCMNTKPRNLRASFAVRRTVLLVHSLPWYVTRPLAWRVKTSQDMYYFVFVMYWWIRLEMYIRMSGGFPPVHTCEHSQILCECILFNLLLDCSRRQVREAFVTQRVATFIPPSCPKLLHTNQVPLRLETSLFCTVLVTARSTNFLFRSFRFSLVPQAYHLLGKNSITPKTC